jgi:hypothetical protein
LGEHEGANAARRPRGNLWLPGFAGAPAAPSFS